MTDKIWSMTKTGHQKRKFSPKKGHSQKFGPWNFFSIPQTWRQVYAHAWRYANIVPIYKRK